MRPLTEDETRQVFEKLHKYLGKAIKSLVDRTDDPFCFRLQRNRVFYVREDVMRRATNVSGEGGGGPEAAGCETPCTPLQEAFLVLPSRYPNESFARSIRLPGTSSWPSGPASAGSPTAASFTSPLERSTSSPSTPSTRCGRCLRWGMRPRRTVSNAAR